MYKNAQVVFPANKDADCIDPFPLRHINDLNAEFHPICKENDFVQKSILEVTTISDGAEIEIRSTMLSLLVKIAKLDPRWPDVMAWLRSLRANSYLMFAAQMKGEFKVDMDTMAKQHPWISGLIFAVVDTDPDYPGTREEDAIYELLNIPVVVMPQACCSASAESVVGSFRDGFPVPRSRLSIQVHFAEGTDDDWCNIRKSFIGLQRDACLFAVPEPFEEKAEEGFISGFAWLASGRRRREQEQPLQLYLHSGNEHDAGALFAQPSGDEAEMLFTLVSQGTPFCIGIRQMLKYEEELLRTMLRSSLLENKFLKQDDNRELWLSRLSLRSDAPDQVEYYLICLVVPDEGSTMSSRVDLNGVYT